MRFRLFSSWQLMSVFPAPVAYIETKVACERKCERVSLRKIFTPQL